MTAQCERCSPRLGELLQWEIENPAAASPAALPSSAPSRAFAAPQVLEGAAPPAASPLAVGDSRATGETGKTEEDQAPASPVELRELWLHAQECAECKSALDVLRSARQVLAALPLQTAPPDLRARVRAQLEAAPQAAPGSVQAPNKSGEPEMLVSAAPAASLPWWRKMLGVNATTGERPFVKRRPAPRLVWAGGGAAVAAFGLALALQIQPPSFGPPSQTSSDAASSAPAPSVGSSQNEVGRRSTSAGKDAKQPAVKAGAKAPAVTRAKPSPGARATDTGAPTEDVPDTPDGGATAGDSAPNVAAPSATTPNDPAPPQMPDVPPPPAVATGPTLAPPTAAPRGVVRRDTADSPERVAAAPNESAASKKREAELGSRANVSRNAGTVIVARELPAAPRREAAGSEGGRVSEGAAPTARSVVGTPSVAESAADSGESTLSTAPGAASESRGSDSAAGGAAAGTFSSEAAPSAAGQSDRNVAESATQQRSRRTRSARPDAPSVPAPAPAPAPPMVGAAAPQLAPENAREAESGAPKPTANWAARSQKDDGRGAAPERITALEARPTAAATRRASVEVKSVASLSRARIEVSLADGWRFARGGPNKRTVWTGAAKRGQAIRVEIEIEPSRANPPARAARVRLLDVANSARPREIASTVLLLATPPSAATAASSSR